ncbi:uncharacterized protein LOC131146425 [Malania oleifera]|uniref:uncharacterized protein LOC131146425 n=1 Tax=Malania oleifera TaxID=397392 RepID=UPI0025AE353F|nr:uncharacterized protein LOC131146425 [Malania oleifera]
MARTCVWYCCILLVGLGLTAEVSEAKKKEVGVYELRKGDFSVKLTNWGATVLSVVLPDRHGKLDDVVLGFGSIKEYTNDSTYFGAIVGRVANRIGGAQFTLDGIHYKLVPNEGKNMLHGGHRGFSDDIWTVESYEEDSHITFTYNSFNGEQGFPGDLDVSVTYMLIETNKLVIRMKANALNKATPVNLASHTYWNLGGHSSGNILAHTLQLFGSKVTPVNDELIPTGAIVPVEGTPYDFRTPHPIGKMFGELPNGYDINYVLDNYSGNHQSLRKAAAVHESKSGRTLELWTNAHGLQFYTSNKLGSLKGKGGFLYANHDGFCLETQGFPDSVNHPNFPSQIVKPGETYDHVMLYRFTAT